MVLKEELLKVIEGNLPKLQVEAIKNLIEEKENLEKDKVNLKDEVKDLTDSCNEKILKIRNKEDEIEKLKIEIKNFEALKLREFDISIRENKLGLSIEKIKRECSEEKATCVIDLFKIPFQNRVIREHILKNEKLKNYETTSDYCNTTSTSKTVVIPKEELIPIKETKITEEE